MKEQKNILTRQVTRSVWQAFYADENGNKIGDYVAEDISEAIAKAKLEMAEERGEI